MRKKLMSMLLAATVCFSLTACQTENAEPGKNQESQEESGKTEGAEGKTKGAGGEVETLTVLTYADWYLDGWKAVEQYIDEHAEELGFRLEFTMVEGGTTGDQYYAAKFATGDLPDLIQFYKPMWIASNCGGQAGLDYLVDLSGLDAVNEYNETDLEGGTYKMDGKVYGLPINSCAYGNVTMYNKAIFEENDIEIPTTWEEYEAVCEKLKAAGVTPMFYSGADGWTLPINGYGLFGDCTKEGISVLEMMDRINTHQVGFAGCEEYIRYTEDLKRLIDKGYVQETWVSDSFDDACAAIAHGDAAMYNMTTHTITNIEGNYPDLKDSFDVFITPSGIDGEHDLALYVPYALGVTTCAKNQELALKALNFICSSEAQQIYADAQPGVYLNTKIEYSVGPQLKKIAGWQAEGKVMYAFEELTKYGMGSTADYIMNYYTGVGSNARSVAESIDEEIARNARAAGDSNWN